MIEKYLGDVFWVVRIIFSFQLSVLNKYNILFMGVKLEGTSTRPCRQADQQIIVI